ncbi:hypothetical protein LTR27_000733 [Elasticomyces elasticus]|nr:hypothetical protein LTR27_000733 [Elasticomyces elasticus]
MARDSNASKSDGLYIATVTSISASRSDNNITQTSNVYTTVYLTKTETATITTSAESISFGTITETPAPSNYTTTLLQTTTFTQSVTQSIPYTVAPSDVDYLQASGTDFCSSFLSYAAPTSTAVITVSPDGDYTQTMYETTSSALDGQATITQSTIRWKRSIPSAMPQYHRVGYVPPNAAVILGYHELAIDRASNGSEPAHVASRMQMLKRQQVQPYASPIPTPDSLVGWPACLVSQACAQVVTGVLATTISTFIPTSTAVVTQTTTETYATASCVAPAEDPAYTAFTPIWGAWNGDSMDPNNPNGGAYMVEAAIQLPFSICLGGYCSSVLTMGADGYVYYNDDITSTQVYLSIYSGQGFGMYVYPYNNGIFYRVAGTPGARSVVISWYTGTYAEGYEQSKSAHQ